MLIEFYCVILTIVPIVLLGELFSEKIEIRQKNEVAIHDSINDFFFDGKCRRPAKCTDGEIYIQGLYKIKIRKPSNPFNQKRAEGGNETLNGLYSDLEKANKGAFDK